MMASAWDVGMQHMSAGGSSEMDANLVSASALHGLQQASQVQMMNSGIYWQPSGFPGQQPMEDMQIWPPASSAWNSQQYEPPCEQVPPQLPMEDVSKTPSPRSSEGEEAS